MFYCKIFVTVEEAIMVWPSVRIDFVNGRSSEMVKVRGFAPI